MSNTPKITECPAFDVIGISVRTNNATEATGAGAIPQQWARFFQESVMGKIPNRADDTVYAVYSDYQKDRNGDYDFTLGVRVTDSSTVAPGMVVKHIPAGEYSVVTSDKGPAHQVIPAAWQEVWKLEDGSRLGGIRSYNSDFEVYDDRSRDPDNVQVDIHVGVK
jgi:predicted transcriptional regulator YdeE